MLVGLADVVEAVLVAALVAEAGQGALEVLVYLEGLRLLGEAGGLVVVERLGELLLQVLPRLRRDRRRVELTTPPS